jgi:hypothetical protein
MSSIMKINIDTRDKGLTVLSILAVLMILAMFFGEMLGRPLLNKRR